MKKLFLLFFWLISSCAFANDPFFIEFGVVTLSDKTPAVTLPLKISTRYIKSYMVPEMVFMRMDVDDVENEMGTPKADGKTTVCTPTVRALVDDGYIGLGSITYGGRIRVSGNKLTLKAIKLCGKPVRFKVRAVAYWNANLHREDFPADLECTRPTDGWCRSFR